MTGRTSLHVYAGCGADPTNDIQNEMYNLNIGDSKLFWKTVKRLTKDSTSIPVLNYEGRNAFSSKDKVDVLSTFVKKCFNSLVQPLSFADLDTFGCCTDKCPDDFLCTVDEVQHLIETLDIAKSTGSDGIAAKMLKSWIIEPSLYYPC